MVQNLFICCKFNHLPKDFLAGKLYIYMVFFCFVLFLILSEYISQGNIFLAINRKSMVKQVSLCWTYWFYKARAAHIYTSGRGKGRRTMSPACFLLNCLSWPFHIPQAEREKGRSLASHKLTAILMTRKRVASQCVFVRVIAGPLKPPDGAHWK